MRSQAEIFDTVLDAINATAELQADEQLPVKAHLTDMSAEFKRMESAEPLFEQVDRGDGCPACGCTRLGYHPKRTDSMEGPGNEEGYECFDCPEWIPMDDEATRRGI